MNKTYLLVGGVALALFVASKVSKYKTFWDKLSFDVSRVKLKSSFPYTSFTIITTIEAYNPTETKVAINSVSGTLSLQGNVISNIGGSNIVMNQGRNNFDVFATITLDQISTIIKGNWNTSNIQTLVKQLYNEKFETDLNFNTSLGNFPLKQTWRLSEF